jgi:FG-GAP-like repeat/FG-GAP repeat
MDRRSPHAYGRSVTKFHVKELETGTMHRGFEHGRNATGPQKLTVLLAGVGLALVLGVTAVAAESTTPSFARARNYAAGHVALSMTASDLNGDGRPDLAAASPDANAVSVLTRRSDGSFEAVQNYRTGRSPFSVASSDLNVDGALDLATANLSADTVSVLVNKGDGSFEPKRDYATGDEPWVVAVGDLNGDGKQDLATANHASRGTVSVLVNRGDGSFQPKRDYVTGSEPREVTIGDLNGDGKPDLATANHDASSVSVLMNNGDGTFRMRRDLATGYGPVSVAIGDVNGDGTADLVVTSVVIAHADTVTVSVFSNRGDGSFRSRINYRAGRYPNSPEYYPDAVALGDLNGDGNPDLAIVNSEEDFVWVLANRGGRKLQTEAQLPHRTYAVCSGDPRSGQRRKARFVDRKRGYRICAHQHTRPLHRARRPWDEAAYCEAYARTRQLCRRDDPPRLLESREGPSELSESQVRRGAPARREGQPGGEPRAQALEGTLRGFDSRRLHFLPPKAEESVHVATGDMDQSHAEAPPD